ncbi:MAG: hypothetical protein J1F17_01575 [Oscillospiraceae bacterium]|nr:hypothetical protein [Oscillospiraceae bacterium]
MSLIKKQLNDLIDCLPEQDLLLLYEVVKRFVHDDIPSVEDIKAINEARQEYTNGETVSHNNINWD